MTTPENWTYKSVPEIVRGCKVLIVEDDRSLCALLTTFFEDHQVQSCCVPNGVEALRKIMAQPFDIVVCDMVMPGMPGDMFYVAVERVKPQLCDRFIFMTGYKSDLKVKTFLERVTCPILYKPFQMSELLFTIEDVLKSKAAQEKNS